MVFTADFAKVLMKRLTRNRTPVLFGLLITLVSLACTAVLSSTETPAPTPTHVVLGPVTPARLKVILQRLEIEFLGQDGHRLIGSGCPGTDVMGSVDNYHFVVRGVDIDRRVVRVLVAGDNSTLTWAWPCSDSWGLLAKDQGEGYWDVYIAPSSSSQIYTLIFFYEDNSMVLGMVQVPGPY